MHSFLHFKDLIKSYFSGGVVCTLLFLLVSGTVGATDHIFDFSKSTLWTTSPNGTTDVPIGSGNNLSTFYYKENNTIFTASGSTRYFNNNGYFMLGASGALLNLPTFEGEKITQIIVHSSNSHSTLVSVNIKSGTSSASTQQTWSTKNKDYTYDIDEACQSQSLSLAITNSRNAQFTKITIKTVSANPTKCVAPKFTPADGTTFTESLTINASTTTTGAKIVYTTAEDEALTKDPRPFPAEGLTITETTTIRAMAVMEDGSLENSDIATATYTKTKKTVTLNFEQDEYTVDINKTITVKATTDKPNADADIKYTTNVDENTCIVDEKTGDVLAGNTPTTVTITATIDEDGEYQGATATCTLNIVDPNVKTTEVVDELTYNDFKALSNSYVNFSNVKKNYAVYAGNSAAGNSSIQLRSGTSSNSTQHSGIVTTTAGGTRLKSVIIEWNNNTSVGRTIDIYGKTTAYSDNANDLYNNETQGVKLGSIEKGTNLPTILNIVGNYPYIGIRSNDGALYINKLTLIWEKTEKIVPITITEAQYATYVTPCAVEFGNEVTAYVVDKINDTDVDIKQITSAPANTAVIVYAEQAGTYSLTQTDNAEEVGTNELKYSETEFTNTTHNIYVLSKKNGNVGFRRLALNQIVPARKVYIIKENTTGAKEFMPIGGETTGITNIVNENRDTKKIYYNLNGMRVDNPQKGIYIVNGKKVIF